MKKFKKTDHFRVVIKITPSTKNILITTPYLLYVDYKNVGEEDEKYKI